MYIINAFVLRPATSCFDFEANMLLLLHYITSDFFSI